MKSEENTNQLAQQRTPQQIGQAEELERNWKPKK